LFFHDQLCPKDHWLLISCIIKFLHCKIEFVYLIVKELIDQNGGVIKHLFCEKLYELFMNTVSQELTEIEHNGRLDVCGKYGEES